jgi:hypothetical protein
LWVRAGLDDPDDDRMPVPSRLDHDLDRLADRGEPTEPPSLSLLLPILVAAAEESRDELQDLWARLLAAAADPSRARSFRIQFIETVK